MLSLNSEVPHGPGSVQLRWLQDQVGAGGTCRLAFWHRPRCKRWNLPWGSRRTWAPLWDELRGRAAIVLSGHEHEMQRHEASRRHHGAASGAGGKSLYPMDRSYPNLAFANDTDWGALRLQLEPGVARFAFVTTHGRTLDSGRSADGRRLLGSAGVTALAGTSARGSWSTRRTSSAATSCPEHPPPPGQVLRPGPGANANRALRHLGGPETVAESYLKRRATRSATLASPVWSARSRRLGAGESGRVSRRRGSPPPPVTFRRTSELPPTLPSPTAVRSDARAGAARRDGCPLLRPPGRAAAPAHTSSSVTLDRSPLVASTASKTPPAAEYTGRRFERTGAAMREIRSRASFGANPYVRDRVLGSVTPEARQGHRAALPALVAEADDPRRDRHYGRAPLHGGRRGLQWRVRWTCQSGRLVVQAPGSPRPVVEPPARAATPATAPGPGRWPGGPGGRAVAAAGRAADRPPAPRAPAAGHDRARGRLPGQR